MAIVDDPYWPQTLLLCHFDETFGPNFIITGAGGAFLPDAFSAGLLSVFAMSSFLSFQCSEHFVRCEPLFNYQLV